MSDASAGRVRLGHVEQAIIAELRRKGGCSDTITQHGNARTTAAALSRPQEKQLIRIIGDIWFLVEERVKEAG